MLFRCHLQPPPKVDNLDKLIQKVKEEEQRIEKIENETAADEAGGHLTSVYPKHISIHTHLLFSLFQTSVPELK